MSTKETGSLTNFLKHLEESLPLTHCQKEALRQARKLIEDLPRPVKRNRKSSIPVKDWTKRDFMQKLREEVHEVDLADNPLDLCEELQDVITVCTTWQEHEGCDVFARSAFAQTVNHKNEMRGSFKEKEDD